MLIYLVNLQQGHVADVEHHCSYVIEKDKTFKGEFCQIRVPQ